MNNANFLFLILIGIPKMIFGQISTEMVPISETYSSNGKFKLQSISYDQKFPNLKGQSFVTYTQKYESPGVRKKFYEINRSFDVYDNYPFFVAISNDGRKIIYIKDKIYYKGDEHKDVTYYVDGKILKSYSTEEFINCNKNNEKCEMFYKNKHQIFKQRKATFKQYKEGVDEQERFLNNNFVFNRNDTIYVIDARKQVTIYDLNTDKFIARNIDFLSIYPKIKDVEAVKSSVTYYKYPYKYLVDIENDQTNEKLSEAISKKSNLKFVHVRDSTFHKYKTHRIELTGYLNRNGKFEIEDFNPDPIFDKKEIENYLNSTIFKTDFFPREVDKIYLDNFYGGYRSFNDSIAKEDTEKEKIRRTEEFKNRLTLEKIGDFYIPKNIYECMTELDKTLNFESKNQLKQAKENESWQFNSHMGSLGMWIRNNWGINGGSRLLKYFNDRKINNRDQISGIIISQYIKWLKGDTSSWREWEKKNTVD